MGFGPVELELAEDTPAAGICFVELEVAEGPTTTVDSVEGPWQAVTCYPTATHLVLVVIV